MFWMFSQKFRCLTVLLWPSGCSWAKDLLGPWRGQRVDQQEGDDHFQTRERLLDGASEERRRVSSFGLPLGASLPEEEASDGGSVHGLRRGNRVVLQRGGRVSHLHLHRLYVLREGLPLLQPGCFWCWEEYSAIGYQSGQSWDLMLRLWLLSGASRNQQNGLRI